LRRGSVHARATWRERGHSEGSEVGSQARRSRLGSWRERRIGVLNHVLLPCHSVSWHANALGTMRFAVVSNPTAIDDTCSAPAFAPQCCGVWKQSAASAASLLQTRPDLDAPIAASQEAQPLSAFGSSHQPALGSYAANPLRNNAAADVCILRADALYSQLRQSSSLFSRTAREDPHVAARSSSIILHFRVIARL
jgi:hypothetical protein